MGTCIKQPQDLLTYPGCGESGPTRVVDVWAAIPNRERHHQQVTQPYGDGHGHIYILLAAISWLEDIPRLGGSISKDSDPPYLL